MSVSTKSILITSGTLSCIVVVSSEVCSSTVLISSGPEIAPCHLAGEWSGWQDLSVGGEVVKIDSGHPLTLYHQSSVERRLVTYDYFIWLCNKVILSSKMD